jgi:hypothetical protein
MARGDSFAGPDFGICTDTARATFAASRRLVDQQRTPAGRVGQ